MYVTGVTVVAPRHIEQRGYHVKNKDTKTCRTVPVEIGTIKGFTIGIILQDDDTNNSDAFGSSTGGLKSLSIFQPSTQRAIPT